MAKRIVTCSLSVPEAKHFTTAFPFRRGLNLSGNPETLRLRTCVLGRRVRAKFCAAGVPMREAALTEGLCQGQLLRY